jgi:Tol biopolymer transport system component
VGSRRARRLGVALACASVAVTLTPVVGPTETRSAEAALPPLSGKIIFMRYQTPALIDWDLYAMRADGSGQRSLTVGRPEDGSPDWSPDGMKIVFHSASRTLGFSEILVTNADGSGRRNLTKTAREAHSPAWSPDGTRIAFVRPGDDAFRDIYVMAADGSGQTNLTNSQAPDGEPAWSPGGTKIVFSSNRGGADFNPEIFLMNADGSGQVKLTSNPAPDIEPAWSPDGSRIAFVRTNASLGRGEILVMNVDGTGERNLTNNPADDSYPAWSPDGTKIAFTTNRGSGGNDEIFVMNADGSEQTNVTRSPANDLAPDWNPQPLFGRPSPRCVVPGVVGRSVRAGRSRIRRANCSVGRIRRLKSQRVGRVISQDPRAGTVRRRGYRVALVVGRRVAPTRARQLIPARRLTGSR